MKWPDRGVPRNLALGFELAGELPLSDVLCPIAPRDVGKSIPAPPGETLFGESAEGFIRSLEANTAPGRLTNEIWDATMKEISEGIAEPLRTKDEMDPFTARGTGAHYFAT